MRIYHAAAEIAPIAKVGGLADVVYGLCRAQIKAGHDVTVILPKYDFIDIPMEPAEDFSCHFNCKSYNNTLWKAELDGIPLLLIEAHHPRMWFSRGAVYVKEDDSERFLYFCKAISDYFSKQEPPDILHMHDWQLGALAALLDHRIKKVTTIHNFYHQGQCKRDLFKLIDLKVEPEWLDATEPRKVNLLKVGILESDRINTVSPTYAKEVMSSKMGFGLEKTLQEQHKKFSGILNGIDYDYWNPETDPLIEAHFDTHSLDKRKQNKIALQEKLGLEQNDRPLIGIITRLVPQKGVDLIAHAIKKCSKWGGQLVLLGSSPFPRIETQFEKLKESFLKDKNIHLELTYNEVLSHMLYAGADLIAVPSLFEPCGLTQLIALRYGAIPLVRHTGGLADTVNHENGFVFTEATPRSFEKEIKKSFSLYAQTDHWQQIQRAGMSQDFSWGHAAEQYLDMYRQI